MIYKYRPEARVSGVRAEVAGPALMDIRERRGLLTAAAVVEEARDAENPLHPAFEWDTELAAYQYNLAQARNLIKAIVVIPDGQPEDTTPVRVFVNVSTEEEGQFYETVVAAYSDDAMRERVIAKAMRDLEAWERRYKELSELAEIFAAARRVRRGRNAD